MLVLDLLATQQRSLDLDMLLLSLLSPVALATMVVGPLLDLPLLAMPPKHLELARRVRPIRLMLSLQLQSTTRLI